ncbi:MAG: hypothetical protein DMG90_09385 [Acidobacteria bacterium]|nr:MAG: hypothetical protein DMG90_09385 [Acidobacteriota bacterium]
MSPSHASCRIRGTLLADPADHRTLEKLGEDCGASKRTIERVFLEETRMNFGKCRQQLRLLCSCLPPEKKWTAASLEAGYNSPSAFIAMFQKQLGTTPTRVLEKGNDRNHGLAS